MTERTQRRLAAIVSADVVGYSRLMGADEAGTLAAMRAHRTELWNPLIEQYGGRVVGTAGDSLLIEYASAVAAVESSVAVQRGMIERNADVPENRHMLLRIGVNIGEVVIDGDDIFGDGINVAARLQAIADSGGIAISGNIHEQVSGKLNVAFSDDGEHEVKNIDRPVRVWRWSPKAQITAGDTAGADQLLPLPDKPSIAVLPFDNMSGDPEQEYFSDGMTEDIITELSRFRNFHVIARNSTFTYKGQAVDIKKVGQELGVRYVLEGSVRKAGSRVRITAQLIEAATSKHVWAERYDRELIDIFDLQDEITGTIASAVLPAFETAELRRIDHVRPENLDAWELTLQASYQNNKGTRKGFAAARELVERAITIDPHNVQALALLSYCITWQVVMSYSTSPEEDMEKGIAGARRALELDPSNAVALRSLSGHLLLSWR
ncbi:MAG TPA: adenylate/guanylate cyclase domain-containing protein, partial [Sneathiellales bacterium]|nr:adenylate/guanylate cyclase domain-containing protein [Sneathiellales bacterium]